MDQLSEIKFENKITKQIGGRQWRGEAGPVDVGKIEVTKNYYILVM